MTTAPAFDMALDLLSKSPDPVADILRTSAYWIPLQFVYVEMVKIKSIEPIASLPRDEKMKYWGKVAGLKKDKIVKVWVCQALYVYESLTLPG